MQWLEHDAFTRELKKLSKKYSAAEQGLKAVKKLLAVQFDPLDPKEVIAPAKIHRRHQNAIWELWKVEMMVVGLRPNQWPRVWFVVSGDTITFLTIGSHIQNYDDNTMGQSSTSANIGLLLGSFYPIAGIYLFHHVRGYSREKMLHCT